MARYRKLLGKITRAEFGFNPNGEMGYWLFLHLGDRGTIEYGLYDVDGDELPQIWHDVQQLLTGAKVQYVSELKNAPVEVEVYEDGSVRYIRIMTELLEEKPRWLIHR